MFDGVWFCANLGGKGKKKKVKKYSFNTLIYRVCIFDMQKILSSRSMHKKMHLIRIIQKRIKRLLHERKQLFQPHRDSDFICSNTTDSASSPKKERGCRCLQQNLRTAVMTKKISWCRRSNYTSSCKALSRYNQSHFILLGFCEIDQHETTRLWQKSVVCICNQGAFLLFFPPLKLISVIK